MYTLEAGKGININKLNPNFAELKNQANSNETMLTTINNTALRKDGSNMPQEVIDLFNQEEPENINGASTIALQDNKSYFLTLTGNGTISLPTISAGDRYSHTIVLTVAGGEFSLDTGTSGRFLIQPPYYTMDTTKDYQVLYVLNKLDNQWYACITQ